MITILAKPSIIRDLPLLKETSKYFLNTDLSSVLIICVQHLYSTTYNMFFELFGKGLNPKNLFVAGKCYSTDPVVYQQLRKDGVSVSPTSRSFNSHDEYDIKFDRNLEQFLETVLAKANIKSFKKIIILDDGGHLITCANKKLPKTLDIIGIEQTSAGYNRLCKNPPFFPVINTARSWVKMKYESPIIINLALKKLEQKIAHLTPHPKKILLMGYGTLGKCIHLFLKGKYDLSYYDANPENSMIQPQKLKKELCKFDLIIGASGETSISRDLIHFLKKPVVLASVSSSDRELDAVFLRKQLKSTGNCHLDLNINGITLLNCGFPINFDSDYSKIDTDDFQLTRSLIFGAVCQAVNTNANNSEFIDLDPEFQLFLESQLTDKTHD